MKQAGRTALRIGMIVLISLTLGGGIYLWNARTIGHNEMPMPFGIGMAVILSGSMEPTLHVNDLAVIVTADAYEPGEIVVYQSERIMVIHRLLAIDDTTAITKGDANNAADEPFPVGLIKGKLLFAVPWVGALVRMVQSVPGVLAIIALAVYLLIRSRRNEQAESQVESEAIRKEIERIRVELQSKESDTESDDTDKDGKAI